MALTIISGFRNQPKPILQQCPRKIETLFYALEKTPVTDESERDDRAMADLKSENRKTLLARAVSDYTGNERSVSPIRAAAPPPQACVGTHRLGGRVPPRDAYTPDSRRLAGS